MSAILNPTELRRKISENQDLLREAVKENPALLDYIFKDAEVRRKYVKVPADVEQELKEAAHQSGVAEGILIGLAIAILLYLLFGAKK